MLDTGFPNAYPNAFFINKDNIPELEKYLRDKKWLTDNEYIASFSKAGEGNMNLTMRVGTSARSFIIKQARPYPGRGSAAEQ